MLISDYVGFRNEMIKLVEISETLIIDNSNLADTEQYINLRDITHQCKSSLHHDKVSEEMENRLKIALSSMQVIIP